MSMPDSLERKLAFLRDYRAYGNAVIPIVAHETHMSWVFLAGDRAYKLKKPVRLSYLDFSTLKKREEACQAELSLNRRLAPHVYLNVVPLRLSAAGISFGPTGDIIDWLVVMRRLDKESMLDDLIGRRLLSTSQLNLLTHLLAEFYRRAPKVRMTPRRWMARWRRALESNRTVLFNSRFTLSKAQLFRIDRSLCRFLDRRKAALAARVRSGAIVEGHGDLRPEHISMGAELAIIDCLEFNREFRITDPLDEIAYLSVECERLGYYQIGRQLETSLIRQLRIGNAEELLAFFRCYRAALKARLMLAHLLEPHPRTPEKWLPLANTYLRIADKEARRIELILNSPTASQAIGPR